MSSKNRILLDFNASGNNKIKHLAIHPRKDFIGIVNTTNNYALWNFKQKILIKSFSCSSLDDSKQVDIKQSIFYDRYSLPTKFQGSTTMRNNIIFITSQRIFLYDYITDVIKSINEKQLEQKNIRKVAIYSENKICIVLNDGSFKVLDIRGLYSKQQQPEATIRTFKGYHTKPITWIFAYSQNINEMPRVITVSSSDGLMACWNVDSLLQSTTNGFNKNSNASLNTMTPCFKFIMSKSTKNDSNNGEEIVSLQYDPSSYHLVTLTQSYITIWSTMTGMELKRVKNTTLKLKQLVFFNHFSFGSSSFIGHTFGSTLYIVRNLQGGAQVQDQINLKQFVQETQMKIQSIKNIPQYPANLFIITSTDLFVLQIDKFYRSSFGVHPSFVTKLTTFNVLSRHFIKKGEGQFKKPITAKQLSKIQFPEDILFNTFYLSYDNGWIYFHLVELQYKNMLHESHKYKLQKIPDSSLFNSYSRSSRTQIMVNFDGKDIILFNKNYSYFEIYAIDQQASNNDRDLIGNQTDQTEEGLFTNSVNFYTSLVMVYSGICRNIVWHQYKPQFAAICGLDKNGVLVNYVYEKQRKGIFGKSSTKTQPKKTGQIKSWHVCIFQKISSKNSQNQNEYQIILTCPPLNTKIFSLFSTGQQFAYSITQKNSQTGNQIQRLQFTSCKGVAKQVQGMITTPQKIFTSYCQTFHIYAYDGYFIIFRVQQNGNLAYYRSIQETILQGMFWQKLFFFATKSGIYFLQILNQAITIRIAYNSPQKQNKQSNDAFENIQVRNVQGNSTKPLFEDLQPECHLSPEGQLQMIGLVNMNLLLVNEIGRQHFLDLKAFPYIQFCLQISSGYLQKAGQIFNHSSQQIRQLMKQTLNSYGLILSNII